MNLKMFLEMAQKNNLTFNHDKSMISTSSINLLGYQISQDSVKPDAECLRILKILFAPYNLMVMAMFAYYSQWIPHFSKVMYPLALCSTFQLIKPALDAFHSAKAVIKGAVLTTISKEIPFVVEIDASNHPIAATLNQAG